MIEKLIQIILVKIKGVNRYISISDDILSTFTKTQKRLQELNSTLIVEEQRKAIEVGKLQEEITKLKSLRGKNQRISENIDKILE